MGFLRKSEHGSCAFVLMTVACQYMINKDKQWQDNPILNALIDTIKNCKCCVNKLHRRGHIDTSKYCNCINILEHVGRTHGERIKSRWSCKNGVAKVTCEMTAGNHHDTLSDNFNKANHQHTDGLSVFTLYIICL